MANTGDQGIPYGLRRMHSINPFRSTGQHNRKNLLSVPAQQQALTVVEWAAFGMERVSP
jgi:hypothetical protein